MSECDCSRCQTEGCDANTDCPCCLRAEVERLTAANKALALVVKQVNDYNTVLMGNEAAIQRVRELHQSHCGSCKECMECQYLMPCPTIRAIEGGSE